MADINEYLEENIIKMFEERDEFDSDHIKERTQHDKNITQMVNGYGALKRIESEENIASDKIDVERFKVETEANLNERRSEADTNWRVYEFDESQKLEERKIDNAEKADKRKFAFGVIGIGVTGFLHLLARRDSREGIISDDRLSFFDKGFNLLTKFIK